VWLGWVFTFGVWGFVFMLGLAARDPKATSTQWFWAFALSVLSAAMALALVFLTNTATKHLKNPPDTNPGTPAHSSPSPGATH
jgi:hypothetical protein